MRFVYVKNCRPPKRFALVAAICDPVVSLVFAKLRNLLAADVLGLTAAIGTARLRACVAVGTRYRVTERVRPARIAPFRLLPLR